MSEPSVKSAYGVPSGRLLTEPARLLVLAAIGFGEKWLTSNRYLARCNMRRRLTASLERPSMTMRDAAPHAQTSRVNPLARAAFVCGIVQFGFFFNKGIALLGIAAIILGHLAVRQIRKTGDRGYDLAKTGLILGYAVWAVALVGTLLVLVIGTGTPVSPSP